jgi:hypothetical protein
MHIARWESKSGKHWVNLAEIAKCDVVCMNCHIIRTSERRKEVMPHESSDE